MSNVSLSEDDGADLSNLPQEYRAQNDEAHLTPSRLWFASSAFPMIAGTLGPVASAFSICALVRPWRQQLVPGGSIKTAPYIHDPSWLLAVNAIQLVVALVANMFLLLNMTKRVRFEIAQPITIIGWYISSLLLIVLLATASGPLLKELPFPVEECVWSQALYYGIWAAILYFLNASLMLVTVRGARAGFYPKEFALTPSQRTLMLQTIMFLIYLLLGALVFSTIENWDYLDGLYWADVTLFTVGFGDYSPSTNLGRALLIPYSLIGIISLGLVIASIRSMILERGRRRLNARMEERRRRRTVRVMEKKGDDCIFKPINYNNDGNAACTPPSNSNISLDQAPTSEYERRRAEFELMRKIQDQASIRRRWLAMAVSTGSWLLLWLIGALVFYQCELVYQDWTYFDGFYFCYVSFTTIGYGDKTLESNAGKSFFVFWSLLTLPAMTVLISNAGDTVVKFIRDATIRLGNITILPGEEGFKGEIKHMLYKLSFGHFFADYRKPVSMSKADDLSGNMTGQSDEEAPPPPPPPPPPARLPEPTGDEATDERGRALTNFLNKQRRQADDQDPTYAAEVGSTFTRRVRRSLSRIRNPLHELPTGIDFHFLLISEIQAISRHLRESKPRHYSFEEWAWYLRLIGEDERDPASHGRPRAGAPKPARLIQPKKPKRRATFPRINSMRDRRHTDQEAHTTDDEETARPGTPADPVNDGEQQFKWSWVGHRSPLMGSQEESEWILDRLTCRLRENLSAERRRLLKRKPVDAEQLARRYGINRNASYGGRRCSK